jgi:hypothetical protein
MHALRLLLPTSRSVGPIAKGAPVRHVKRIIPLLRTSGVAFLACRVERGASCSCHVERSAAESRHLAAILTWLYSGSGPSPGRILVRPTDLGARAGHGSFAARSLHSGLRPSVEMTRRGASARNDKKRPRAFASGWQPQVRRTWGWLNTRGGSFPDFPFRHPQASPQRRCASGLEAATRKGKDGPTSGFPNAGTKVVVPNRRD